jgi:CRISPR/Cas system CMR-associated protein Cmr1 (group 7 of RAMP superfamily)
LFPAGTTFGVGIRANRNAAHADAPAILVATFMRVGFFAVRPFLGFGMLGAVLLLRGLRRWYEASEFRELHALFEEKIVAEEADKAIRLQRRLGKTTQARSEKHEDQLRKWQRLPKD